MNYGEIKPLDISNGTGVRVSLFVSGCRNRCKGCFNPQTWNFDFGKEFDAAAQDHVLNLISAGHVSGLSLLGGEPFEPENQKGLLGLLRKVKEKFPQKDIWAYTGCVLERDILSPKGRAHCECTEELLSLIDVLVDGPFIEERKDISLAFRGSDNQRIIDLPATIEAGGDVVLWRAGAKGVLRGA